MLSWEEIVQNYIVRHSDQIKKVTQPLRQRFGVGYFTYHRIENNGKYTVLVDRPDWAEHYVAEKFFLEDPHLRHPDLYRPGFCLIETAGTEEYRERILKVGKEMFNLDFGVTLIEKGPGFVEFFGFAGNKSKSSLDKVFIHHSSLLKSFASHFKKELSPVLLQMEEEASSLIDLKGKDFFSKELLHPELSPDICAAYLEDLGLKSEVAKAASLSPRERQCLKLLIDGKSSKETALLLGLSARTVESYFENIKNKLSCWTKQDLFSMAKLFKDLSLLP